MRFHAILLLLILLLLPVAFGQTLALSPVQVYEGSLQSYNLTVNNLGGSVVYTNVAVDLTGFSNFSPTDYLGWAEGIGSSGVSWQSGTIENNVFGSLFSFMAQAPIVTSNTTYNVTATVDNVTNSTTVVLPVLIVEDLSAPILSSPVPVSGGLMLAGIPAYEVSVVASDAESGMDSVSFSHAACGDNLTSYLLSENSTNWSSTLSFAQYNTSITSCFEFRGTNNAGLAATYSGNITFDGTAPTVTLLSPLVNASSGVLTPFTFSALDDLAHTLSCELFVNGSLIGAASLNTTANTTVVANLSSFSDGNYTWSVTCSDTVGLNSTSSRQITLDATPPSIVLNSPLNGSLISIETIDYSVTDANGVASVVTSHPVNTSTWTQGVNVFEINATDLAGNFNSAQFTFTIDRTAPAVTLLGPSNGTQVDTYVNVTFNVVDTFDSSLSCTVDSSDNSSVAVTASSGANTTVGLTLPRGNITWTVSCLDDVNNTGVSTAGLIEVLDMSGPSISSTFSALQRGVATNLPATVSDPSGVDSVWFVFENVSYSLSDLGGNNYSTSLTIPSNHSTGNFSGTFFANDTNGYQSSFVVNFTLVPAYFITFTADSQFDIGEQIVFNVKVENDQSDNLSGSVIQLETPYYYVTNGTLSDENTFGDNFGVGPSAATYTLTAKYEADGFEYVKVHVYGVGQPPAGGGSGGSNGPNSPAGSSSGGSGGSNAPNSDASSSESSSSSDSSNSESNAPNSNSNGGENTETSSEESNDAESERSPLGVGQASGLFNLGDLNPLWWVLIALMGLLLGLFIASRYRKATALPPKPMREDSDLDWDDYFNRNQ